MFTKGQLFFAVLFAFSFILFMIWSYRKDIENHKIHYKNTAKKVGFWLVIVIAVFILIELFIKS